MANWICKQDGVQFPPGMPCCPECQTRDAHEQGGDKSLNLYDAVEVTNVGDPGAAWALVNEGVAAAIHDLRQDSRETMSHEDGVARVMAGDGEAEVAERLGDVDATYREPDRSLGLPDDANPVDDRAEGEQGEAFKSTESAGDGGESGDAVPGGDNGYEASAEDTPGTGKAKSTTKARQKDVPS